MSIDQKNMTHQDIEQAEGSAALDKKRLPIEYRGFKALLPCILGLACARTSQVAGTQGSYLHAGDSLTTDEAILCALGVLFIMLIIMMVRKNSLSKKAVNTLVKICIVAETICIVGYGMIDTFIGSNQAVHLVMSALATLFASGCIFYWLRRMRGSGTITAAVFVFNALFMSEVLVIGLSIVPSPLRYLISCACVLLQFPLIAIARKQTQPYQIETPLMEGDYFGFAKSLVSNKQFLTITAVYVGFLSVVIGLFRGYPDGTVIPFTPVTIAGYLVLVLFLNTTMIYSIRRAKKQAMSIGMWLVLQILGSIALLSLAAFPAHMEVGAVFTSALNAMMTAFVWYVIIAFMSFGWRDPYYYACAGWIVWLGCRSLACLFFMRFHPLMSNSMLMGALIGVLLLLSTQVVFVQFIKFSHFDANPHAEKEPGVVSKLMGLDGSESGTEVRLATMQRNAAEIGKQFMLSQRETEVLALYALGYTQKRVAEELFITPDTAHAHIKHIYSKTGFHSRQEILDYMGKYAS